MNSEPTTTVSLTDEQQEIVETDLESGEILKIIAFAGTGKTTTLVEYAKARPQKRFLYLAFNKSVQLEALKRFPANVISKTSHALAFQSHGYKYKDRLVPKFRANNVFQSLDLNQFEDARFTIDTLYNYLISPDPKVSKWHIPFQASAFYKLRKESTPQFIKLIQKDKKLDEILSRRNNSETPIDKLSEDVKVGARFIKELDKKLKQVETEVPDEFKKLEGGSEAK